MSTVTCPQCDAPLTRQEAVAGWCDSCGRRLPVHVASDPAFRTRRPEVELVKAGQPPQPEPPKPPVRLPAAAVVGACLAAGAAAGGLVTNGNLLGLGLGAGLGAGAGAAVAWATAGRRKPQS